MYLQAGYKLIDDNEFQNDIEFGGLFRWFPAAALINDKIFCVHCGISPQVTQLEQINCIIRGQIPDSDCIDFGDFSINVF